MKLDLPEEYTPRTEISGHQEVRLAWDSSRSRKPSRRLIRSSSRKLSTTFSRIGFSCCRRRFRSRSLLLIRCSVAIRSCPLRHLDQGCPRKPAGRLARTLPFRVWLVHIIDNRRNCFLPQRIPRKAKQEEP